MDFIISLFHSHPLIAIVLILIIIGVVASIVRGLIKLALILALVAVIAIVFFGVNPQQILNTGHEVTQEATNYYQKTLKPIVDKEILNAKYTEKDDGSYEVKTASLSITGKSGDDIVVISYKGSSTKVNMSLLGDKFKEFIESHNQNN